MRGNFNGGSEPDPQKSLTVIGRTRRHLVKIGAMAAAAVFAKGKPSEAHFAPPPPPPLIGGSLAYAVSAEFEQDGAKVRFGPLTKTSGSVPFNSSEPYSSTASTGPVRQVAPIVAGSRPTPSLFFDAASLDAHVAGSGGSTIRTEADIAIKGLDLALMLNPAPPGPEPQPFLALTARHLSAAAVFTKTGKRASVEGSAAVSALTVGGSLIGKHKLEFSGEATKNKVLFQDSQVTITLNKEIIAGEISKTAPGAFEPDEITAHAVHIVLTDVDLDGRTVSGKIILGMAEAG